MDSVQVKKTALLKILKKNLRAHKRKSNEALKIYQEAYIAVMEKNLEIAKKTPAEIVPINQISLPVVQDHVTDYEKVIGMLELSVDETIELDFQEYNNYVQDEWGWSGGFNSVTMAYTSCSSSSSSTQGSSPSNSKGSDNSLSVTERGIDC